MIYRKWVLMTRPAICSVALPMKIKPILQTATALFVLTASAFADKPEKDIVGKWADVDGAGTVEYKADGTFTETVGGETLKGKYSFPDATHIKAEMEGPMSAMGAVISAITIKGDTMDVTEASTGTVEHFKRQK